MAMRKAAGSGASPAFVPCPRMRSPSTAGLFNFLLAFAIVALLVTFVAQLSDTSKRCYGKKAQRNSLSIAVVTVMIDWSKVDEYRLAMDTFECYCTHWGYRWAPIAVSDNHTLQTLCNQSHFFQRHCVVAQFLEEQPYEYVLFIDSDMGVVNPLRRIEEFLTEGKDLIFYNRVFSPEITAGSYIAKRTRFSIEFLRMWADFDARLPNSFNGFDNVALHPALLETARLNLGLCQPLWNSSKRYADLFVYVSCVRMQLDQHTEVWQQKIQLLPKGTAWSRDGWLTDSRWSDSDFVFHGWQKWRENGTMFAGWTSPFTSHDIDKSLCSGASFMQNWRYKPELRVSKDAIRSEIQRRISSADAESRGYRRRAISFLNGSLS